MGFFSDLKDSFKKPEVYLPAAGVALGAAPYFFPETFSGGGILGGLGSLGRGLGSTVGVNYPEVPNANPTGGGGGIFGSLFGGGGLGGGAANALGDEAKTKAGGGISNALLASILATGGQLGTGLMNVEAAKDRAEAEESRYERTRQDALRRDKIELQLMLLKERKAAAQAAEEGNMKAKKMKIAALQAAMGNINAQGAPTAGAFNTAVSGVMGAYG